jgi:hypothetical protein
MARPSKFTPEVRTHILLALRAGSHLTVAAASAGVCEATLHRWLTDRRPQFRAFAADARQAIAEGEVFLVGRIGQAVHRSPGVALKLLERRHPQRWGPGRLDMLQVPDEFPAETPEPGPQKPPTLQERVVALPPEWQLPIIKLFTAAALGKTPAEFFEGPDRLASLRESDPPPDPWWKQSGEPFTPTLPGAPPVAGNASAGTPAAADEPDGSGGEDQRG